MSPLLVATDLSPRSELAFARALQLARGGGDPVHLLFVVDDALPPAVGERLRREGEALIGQQLLPRAAAAGVETTLAVRSGRAAESILAEADAVGAGLVLLGAHRRDDARDMFLGSTAWRVLRDARRPVLQVRDPVTGPYQRVLAALDLTPAADAALRLACRLAPTRQLSAVHAFRVPFVGTLPSHEERQETAERHRAAVEQRIAATLGALSPGGGERPVAVHAEVHGGDVIEVIRRECDRVRPDLLVIGTRGRAGVEDAFHKSIAESLLRGPPCDVAAVAAVESAP
jgi:nucleotide-binding universal stress UspA family protein